MMWLAETKGEIRPNTALKSEAAELWCEKMSGTTLRPVALPVRAADEAGEAALAAGVAVAGGAD